MYLVYISNVDMFLYFLFFFLAHGGMNEMEENNKRRNMKLNEQNWENNLICMNCRGWDWR